MPLQDPKPAVAASAESAAQNPVVGGVPSIAQLVDVPNPQRGGSYARDPVTGALTLIVPPTADLNTTAPAEE